MQVDMHHVETHITWTTSAEHWIEVSTIVVHQTTAVVNQFRNRRDTCFEKTKGIGIGHHHRSDVRALLCDDPFQVFQIYQTFWCRLHLDNL